MASLPSSLSEPEGLNRNRINPLRSKWSTSVNCEKECDISSSAQSHSLRINGNEITSGVYSKHQGE